MDGIQGKSNGPNGFTLIEMLAVIAVLAILLSLTLPIITHSMERGRKARCLSNLRQIAVAATLLFEDSEPNLPDRGDNCLDWGKAAAQLLPYLGNNVHVFDCPSNKGIVQAPGVTAIPGYTNVYTEYECNGYLADCDPNQDVKQSGITSPSQAAYVYDYPFVPGDPRGRPHAEGINVAYLDGHAAWLRDADMHLDGPEWQKFYGRGHIFAGGP